MLLRPARNMSLRRWLLVACFSSVKNHNVLGPHLFPSVTTHAKKSFCLPRTDLHRAKKSLCNTSQFRTLFLPHRFIKIRPSHQRPINIEFLTICRIPKFPKSEQNRKSCGNVRKRAAVRRKNHSNLNKSFGINIAWIIISSKIYSPSGFRGFRKCVLQSQCIRRTTLPDIRNRFWTCPKSIRLGRGDKN